MSLVFWESAAILREYKVEARKPSPRENALLKKIWFFAVENLLAKPPPLKLPSFIASKNYKSIFWRRI